MRLVGRDSHGATLRRYPNRQRPYPNMLTTLKSAIRPLTVWADTQGPIGRHQQRKQMRIYSQFIKTGDFCFDIGANVGNVTDTFLKLGARVVCVEPQERCIRILTRRFGRSSKVILVPKGLSDSAAEAEIWTCDNNDAIATMSPRWMTAVRDSGRLHFRWSKRQKVSVITLDALIREYGAPTLCKIDVEGFELRVLRGLSRPLPYIAFEFHEELMEDAKACADYIQSLGLCEFNYSTDRSLGLCLDAWLPLGEAFALISAAMGPLAWGDIFARSR